MDTQNNSRYLQKCKKAFKFKCKLQPSHPYNHVLRHLQVLDHYRWILLNSFTTAVRLTLTPISHIACLVTSSSQDRLSSLVFWKTGGSKVWISQKNPVMFTTVKLFVVWKIPLVFFVIAHASFRFSQPSKRINFKTAKRMKENVWRRLVHAFHQVLHI